MTKNVKYKCDEGEYLRAARGFVRAMVAELNETLIENRISKSKSSGLYAGGGGEATLTTLIIFDSMGVSDWPDDEFETIAITLNSVVMVSLFVMLI